MKPHWPGLSLWEVISLNNYFIINSKFSSVNIYFFSNNVEESLIIKLQEKHNIRCIKFVNRILYYIKNLHGSMKKGKYHRKKKKELAKLREKPNHIISKFWIGILDATTLIEVYLQLCVKKKSCLVKKFPF